LTTAKSELQDPNGDMQNLEDNLASSVRSAFQQQYSYAFNGASSLPPNAQKDQNGMPVKLVPGEDFTTCAYNSSSSISSYIDTNIVNSNVPIWAQASLRNELIGALTSLLSGPATDGWLHSPQAKTITGGANSETLQADIILLYCVTNAPDPKNQGQNVKTLFCKYIGVYYLGVGWGLQSAVPSAVSAPDSVQILAIDCSVSSAALATALGVQIVRTQPSSVNTIFTVTASSLSVCVAVKCATNDTDGTAGTQQISGQPMPLDWFVDILKENKVTYSQNLRTATSAEYQELQYLDHWDTEASFKKGDFSSLQY
jgi:hypothetical protein